MKRIGWVLVAAAVAIAAFVTLRRVRERAELEDEWESEMPATVGFDDAMAEESAAGESPLVEDAEVDDAALDEEVVVEEVEVAVADPISADEEATFVTDGPLVDEEAVAEAPVVEEEAPAIVEAPPLEEPAAAEPEAAEPEPERDDDTMEGPSPVTRLHTDRDTAELRDRIAESRSRMRAKARGARGGGAEPSEPEASEPEAG